MNDVLYHKSMALCPLPYEKVQLKNTSAEGYLYQVIADTEADWVINIDEDAFVTNVDALVSLLDFCMGNGYVNCGMPDGGVVHLRDGNPLVTNPYLNILNTKALREQFSIDKFNESPDKNRFTQTDLLVGAHDFTATDIEPFALTDRVILLINYALLLIRSIISSYSSQPTIPTASRRCSTTM